MKSIKETIQEVLIGKKIKLGKTFVTIEKVDSITGWEHVSSHEFHEGVTLNILVSRQDKNGRKITTYKNIDLDEMLY